MKKSKHSLTAWLLVGALWVVNMSGANAELVIKISRGVERPVPIAVVPFGYSGSGPVPFDVAELVARDLDNSGRFQSLPRSLLVSKPIRGSEVDFQDWRQLQVDVLVIGRLEPQTGDRHSIIFQVFNTLRGELLMSFRMASDNDVLRRASHRVADMIYEKLTGIAGVFSTQIAYITVDRSGGETRHRLIVADADGEGAEVAVNSPEPLMSPAWSPDGRKLAYVSFEGRRSAIYVQTLSSGQRELVSARAGINGAPVFSPDGRRLALTLSRDDGNLDIYVLELRSQVLTRLTWDPAIDTEATFSPDGKDVYFTSDRAGGPQIYRVPAAGRNSPKRVTFEGNYNARPRVSPDGKQLAVVFNDRGNYRIAVADIARGTTEVLTQGRLDESPGFAPNGAEIIYATRADGAGVLASISTDGRIARQIAAVSGEVREPIWGPRDRY
jgi:TolB protein